MHEILFFFQLLIESLGVYIFLDDNTILQSKIDVFCSTVRIINNSVLNKDFNIMINGEVFRIKVVEDSQYPLRVCMPTSSEDSSSRSEAESDEKYGDWFKEDIGQYEDFEGVIGLSKRNTSGECDGFSE